MTKGRKLTATFSNGAVLSRKEAMLQAATKSRSVGTAYAIAHEDDEDIGQRVYERGRFCYQEGAY